MIRSAGTRVCRRVSSRARRNGERAEAPSRTIMSEEPCQKRGCRL
ncbi:hypothetical protein XOCgx_0927 [Xanthomonas oryzae pv. oryzicola]|nr:hypothetical protein XOCgx_0927 [Xanthomonas oryzae pv. oryzicola]